MKLIIELSENDYKALKEDGVQNHLTLVDTIIARSVPYEERPQGDLISRSYLKQMIPAPIEDEYKYVHQIIDNAPSVGVSGLPKIHYDRGFIAGYEKGKTERPQGKWIEGENGNIKCNQCGCEIRYSYLVGNKPDFPKFCCDCGAKMMDGVK